jgi:hypothetical protein
MIIDVPVHAAYAYDMYAILYIKHLKLRDMTALNNLDDMFLRIQGAVGNTLHRDILASDEYRDLYDANLCVFEHIDLIKQRPATGADATYIDQMNHARYLAKLALQKRFFPDCPFTEQKIGYDKGAA